MAEAAGLKLSGQGADCACLWGLNATRASCLPPGLLDMKEPTRSLGFGDMDHSWRLTCGCRLRGRGYREGEGGCQGG